MQVFIEVLTDGIMALLIGSWLVLFVSWFIRTSEHDAKSFNEGREYQAMVERSRRLKI